MLHTKAVERNTLELLKSLMQKDYLSGFFLAGGTALALQIGHRKSVDLDLFTNVDFDSDLILAKLLNDYNPTVLLKMPQTLICTINQIKVDFIRYRYPLIRPLKELQGIRMAETDDIAPMKLDAITGRGSKKDFFDLFFLLKLYKITALLDLYKEKYSHQTVFHVIRSMAYFKDAENDPDPLIVGEKVGWTEVKKAISKEIQSL
jgi:hypothetical protein